MSQQPLPCVGDARLRTIQGMLKDTKFPNIHQAFIEACLPIIYGRDEWDRHSARVLAEMGLEKVRAEVMASGSGGQWDDIRAMGIFVAALMSVVPGVEIAACTPGKHKAQFLVNEVKASLLEWGFIDRFVRFNDQEMFLSDGSPQRKLSKLHCQGARGKLVHVVVVPSVASIPVRQILDEIAPFLSVQNTVLLASRSEHDSNELVNLTDSKGEPVFRMVADSSSD